MLTNYGETPSSFLPRMSGTEKEHRLGEMNDFATFTATTSVRVRVVSSVNVWADSSDEELQSYAVGGQPVFPTDDSFVKSRVVFAVLNNNHWDLGVLRRGKRVQAVFREDEWEAAQKLAGRFCQIESSPRGSEHRDDGCHQVGCQQKREESVRVKESRRVGA